MAEAKKKVTKKSEKKSSTLKITKPNGRVITRQARSGVKEHYEKLNWKVEEV